MSESNNSYQTTSVSDQQTNSSFEDIQVALAPHIQSFLAQTGRRYSCCNVMLPLLFERSSSKSFLNPRFDSQVLEEQYQISIFSQIRLRFRFALLYIICMAIVWLLYFFIRGSIKGDSDNYEINRAPLYISVSLLVVISTIASWITYKKFFKYHTLLFSGCFTVLFITICLSLLKFSGTELTMLGHFTICIICIICIYTVIPLPLWLCFILAFLYSMGYEVISYLMKGGTYFQDSYDKSHIHLYKIVTIRVLLHFCVHLISIHMLLMSVVRYRGTFMKVGQNLLVRRQLEMEKQLKEKMITSMMPKVVADMLLKETRASQSEADINPLHSTRPRTSSASDLNLKSMFRPFHMHSMGNVSILFADIVGFTKMSSTKTAEELVEILNDLFERFDDLCEIHGCEKISTLGDCYYCVSGCPHARKDHAICCIEMGLGMIEAMRVFDSQRHEGIKMRVGVHTGNVLCGIVGTKRVKFDVWSNDVTFANKMESTGMPDQVHLSEETKSFLGDLYILREAEEVDGHRTYFIVGRKQPISNDSNNDLPSFSASSPVIHASKSLSPSPILPPRRRLASISGTVSKLLSSAPFHRAFNDKNIVNVIEKKNPKIMIDERSISEASVDNNPENNGVLSNSSSNKCMESPNSNSIKVNNINSFNSNSNNNNIINNNNTDCDTQREVPYIVEQNGYQQIPLVVVAKSSSAEKHETEKIFEDNNITDLKSYISQSRSDVSPFGRTSSYRSYHHQGNHSSHSVYRTQYGNQLTPWYHNDSGECVSLTSPSRKDSGIRSNSRRSSIQHTIYAMNKTVQSHNRVSGYFTSSQSSLAGEESVSPCPQDHHGIPLPSPTTIDINPNPNLVDPIAACVQQLRKQSDLQLIKCVRDNARSQRSYLVKPPLYRFSLRFKSNLMERLFRHKAHRDETEDLHGPPPTLATPKYNTCIDMFVLSIVYIVIALSLFLLSPSIYVKEYKIWVCCFVVFSTLVFSILFLCIKQICRQQRPPSLNNKNRKLNHYFNSIFGRLSNWYQWHFFGSILITIPALSVLINFAIVDIKHFNAIQFYYGLLFFLCLIHFCNFIQLNCWTKNLLAFVCAIAFLAIALNHMQAYKTLSSNNNINHIRDHNTNYTNFSSSNSHFDRDINWFKKCDFELCLDLILLMVLVVFLNREFEIGYRSSFYGNEVAQQDKIRVQNMKNQAELLLDNIVPKFVVEQLKNTAKYSENHHDVGIIFASIVNFNEMYDESYLGGKEYLRVLNELIGDFDELLSRDEFKCVEKIKTIGSTYMAASGLDSTYRKENSSQHLYALLDFAVAMQNALETFNRDLLEFNLILRIGYNHGDVTAGVIGTSKLYYDIWGDAVNVSSRMQSVGVSGRIQMPTTCTPVFQDLYEFESYRSVYVKGKDNMSVCLLKGKKPESLDLFQEDEYQS